MNAAQSPAVAAPPAPQNSAAKQSPQIPRAAAGNSLRPSERKKGQTAGAPPPATPGSADDVRQNLRGMNYQDGSEYVQPGGKPAKPDEKAEAPDTATAGEEGKPVALPHLSQVQKAFGKHDLSNVQAVIGGAGAAANKDMGAQAFTVGNTITFKKSPDLWLVAHEAAHVVQQRQGRLPAGGEGKPGDALEKEANQAADRVVAGQSAADLLGEKTDGATAKGGAGVAIQKFAGNVDTATTSGAGSVREQVEKTFGNGPAGERDSNFNPQVKVEFEGKLGRALLLAQAYYRPIIDNVSYGIYRYLQAKAEVLAQDEKKVMEQAFESFSFMYDAFEAGKQAGGVFYGRIRDDMADKGAYFQQMTDLLLGGRGSVQNHMLAHQCFLDKVLDAAQDGKGVGQSQPAAQFVQRMQEQAAQRKDAKDKQLASASAPDLKHLRKTDAGEADPFGERSKGVNGMEARGRLDMRKGFNPKKGGVDPAGQLPPGVRFDERLQKPSQVQSSMGIADEGGAAGAQDGELGLNQVHSRGIETYTLDESQTFVQEARTQYNMPMAAGISGTTTDLHEVAKMFGVVSGEDQFKYQLGCLAHLSTAGAHSFHEIMAAAALNTQVSYEPGNYRSILKYGVEGIPEVKALFDDPQYAEIPGIGDPARLAGKTSEAPKSVAPPPPPAPKPAGAPAPAA